jgi:hypothetical protein
MELLIEALKVDCIATRVWAAHTLAKYGPAAHRAIPLLKKIMRMSRSESVRQVAADAVRRICRERDRGNAIDRRLDN